MLTDPGLRWTSPPECLVSGVDGVTGGRAWRFSRDGWSVDQDDVVATAVPTPERCRWRSSGGRYRSRGNPRRRVFNTRICRKYRRCTPGRYDWRTPRGPVGTMGSVRRWRVGFGWLDRGFVVGNGFTWLSSVYAGSPAVCPDLPIDGLFLPVFATGSPHKS